MASSQTGALVSTGEDGLQTSLDNFTDGDYEDDDEDYDLDDEDDFINELQDLEAQSSRGFKGLDAVKFDDDEEEEGEELLGMSKYGPSKALALAGSLSGVEDDGADIGSDEERDILREIREDIDQKVREEMKEELNGYQERMKAIQEGRLPGRTDDEKNNDSKAEEDEEMNPQLKEAIIKMNKLDKILRKKVKREREVKRDRILLERRMRQEISSMEHGASNYREIKMNTERFLALAPPPSHNEGVSLEPEEDEEMPPLFQTQFDESELDRRKKGKKTSASDGNMGGPEGGEPRSGSSVSSQGARSRSSRSGVNQGSRSQGKKNKKNFIKRNKELAAEADQPVAMTDDEKRRLQTLLEGVDDLPEIEEGEESELMMDLNPFQLSVQPGEGFCPDNAESRTLTAIDKRLKNLMPDEDYRAVFTATGAAAGFGMMGERGCRTSHDSSATPAQPLFTRVGMHSTANDAVALDRFGERVLYETKEERELKAKLQAIESQLEQFNAPHDMEDENAADCHLTDQQLDELLDQCARNMAPTVEAETPESTPRSQLSSRQSLLANPPRLTDEQLQQLLSDAHFPLSSRLLALRDDDQKLEEEEGNTEVIRAETWIAIRDAELGNGEAGSEETRNNVDGASDNTKAGAKPSNSDTKLSLLQQLKANAQDLTSTDMEQRERENISTNNACFADASARSEATAGRAVDDFAYSPDLTNPASGQNNSSDWRQEGCDGLREGEGRRNSGGAHYKTGRVGALPMIPQPPQLASSSFSSIRASEDPSAAAPKFNSSSYASTSRSSFDSAASIPTNNNNDNQFSTVDGQQTPVRFPEIPSKSFLIHTPQGMRNNEKEPPRSGPPSRQQIQMVRNNLSDMSVTSLSEKDGDSRPPTASNSSSQSHPSSPAASYAAGKVQVTPPSASSNKAPGSRRTSLQQPQGMQPTPPTTKKPT